MAQRQQPSLPPLPDQQAPLLSRTPILHSRNAGCMEKHADHFEAASWNGPAHADRECTLEETPKPPGKRATSPHTDLTDPWMVMRKTINKTVVDTKSKVKRR